MALDEPGLQEQTIALGKLLKARKDSDPKGVPSQTAAVAFTHWLKDAEPSSREPQYFADVAQNYDIFANSNADLFVVFELLHPYIEVNDEEPLA